MQQHQLLWGKTGPNGTSHPALAHMIDVGVMAEALAPILAQRIPRLGEVEPRTMGFLAACHDVGKIAPAFQAKWRSAIEPLRTAGFPIPAGISTSFPHALATTKVLPDLLEELGMNRRTASSVSYALGGHHGLWPSANEVQALDWNQVGGGQWDTARKWIVKTLFDLFHPGLDSVPRDNAWLALFSGLVSVVDWLGSDKERFPIDDCADPVAYLETARQRAHLDPHDWHIDEVLSGPPWETAGFTPHAVQANALDAANAKPHPHCIVVEAQTGRGKTEAALAAAAASPGLYVAMPTMATANAMHERIVRYAGDGVRLAHSRARWLMPRDWFTPSKQTLMAPLGVGTVDQTLLAALNGPHWFVRLLGLAGKTVIFDEVHAYDLYMSAVFDRLLEWLRAVDANVVVLSATLTESHRKRISRAYGPDRVTFVADPEPDSRRVDLRRTDDIVGTALASPGSVGIVVNTVKRCQTLAAEIQQHVSRDELLVLHARMTAGQREVAEHRLLRLLGPDSERPKRLIVVATQVIEQSLDIDLDVLITALAPVDSIVQRIGRLHRHRKRGTPVAWLAPPGEYDSSVYGEWLLLRTKQALDGREYLDLPDDSATLLAHVYDEPDVDALGKEEMDAWQAIQAKAEEAEGEAEIRLVPAPGYNRLLMQSREKLADENETDSHRLAMVTRLGRPSVRLVVGGDPEQEWQELADLSVPVSHQGVVRWLFDNREPTWRSGALAGHYYLPLPAVIGDYSLRLDQTLGLVINRA